MKKGWHERQINDVCLVTDYVANGSFASLRENVQYLDDGGYAVLVRLADSTRGWNGSYKYVSEAAYRFLKKTALYPGDLIMSNVGEPGKVFEVPDLGEPMTLGPNSVLIRCHAEQCSNRFLYFYFSSNAGRSRIDNISEGVAQRKFNKTAFRALKLMLPLLAEQQRIVCVLDEAFAGLATAQANAERNLQNARALFESHLRSVFTQRGKGWVQKTVDKLSTNLDSKRVPITKNVRKSGQYPYYGASGIVDYVADYIFEGDTLLVSEDGANLLARSTPIAFSVTGKYWVNNHAHILKFENMATQRFVEFYFESIKLDEYITGAAQPKLNQKALNSIRIPIPTSIDEQAKIVSGLESLANEVEHLESLYEQKQRALADLKESLLHRAFSGAL